MEAFAAEDGCPAFRATVTLDDAAGQQCRWGVPVDTHDRSTVWGVPTEILDPRYRTFTLATGGQVERYGGDDLLNADRVASASGALTLAVPANSVVVLARV